MLSKFLLDAKKLNIPRQNSMSREGLKKTFKDTIINIKRYFFYIALYLYNAWMNF